MTKIENENQYRWALNRVEEILPFVKDDTPLDDPYSIELDLLSGLVADYSDEHYSISRMCEYLSGKKEPTLRQARVISSKLNIDPAIVLGE